MKIVFYSTVSLRFSPNPGTPYYYPLRADMFDEALAPYRDDNEFVLVTRRPAAYLVDMDRGQIGKKAYHLEHIMLDALADADEAAQIIIDQKPDLAVAISIPDYPYDWSYLKESIIAERLKDAGIHTN